MLILSVQFQFFWFLNQFNIYLGKVTKFWGIITNKILRNLKIPLGGWNPPPPTWVIGFRGFLNINILYISQDKDNIT